MTRLPGIVQTERVVPVLGGGDDLKRSARCLIVGVAGRADGKAVAAARNRTHIQARAYVGRCRVGHRMANECVMILVLSPAPRRGRVEARTQLARKLGDG